jgi:hypothetical protein
VVAEHADVWNFPGGDVEAAVRRGALLDRFCAEIGRDPASITRSLVLRVAYDHPGSTRDSIAEAIGADFRHVVLSLPAPYPENVARWITDDRDALRYAKRQGITTGETLDLMSIAVANGDIAARAAFELMTRMNDAGRHLRLPRSAAELAR